MPAYLRFCEVNKMLEVKKFAGNYKEILPLADVYMRSYNELSKGYKTKEEMALYTKFSFIKKLEGWAINQEKGNEPFIYVLHQNGQPCGIMRLNPIPQDYRRISSELKAKELENGELDGWRVARNRQIQYVADPHFDENTLILNQIYLAPESQKQGLGTFFIKTVFQKLQKQGYDQFIVEYNDNNANGKKFHEDVLCAKKIAHTSDFDHITSKDAKTEFCLSPVSIGISRFSTVLQNIKTKEKAFTRTVGR